MISKLSFIFFQQLRRVKLSFLSQLHSRLMRYRGRSNGKEDGKGSKKMGRGGWLVKDDEGTETPNGMHLLH